MLSKVTPQNSWLKTYNAEPYIDWSVLLTPNSLTRLYYRTSVNRNRVYNVDSPISIDFSACLYVSVALCEGSLFVKVVKV